MLKQNLIGLQGQHSLRVGSNKMDYYYSER